MACGMALAAAAVGKELLIPYPRAVFLTLAELGKTAEFWRAVLLTMLRITSGYVSGLIVGSVCAVLSARFRVFRDIFAPIPAPYTRSSRSFLYNFSARMDKK